MMYDQGLPTSLWEKSSITTMYIHNKIPHSILEEKTLEEVFTSKKPYIAHLKIFGCHVYIHVPKGKRKKMEHSEKKGIFFCYSESSKAYVIYVPGERHIEVSRDVGFHKEAIFKCSKEL